MCIYICGLWLATLATDIHLPVHHGALRLFFPSRPQVWSRCKSGINPEATRVIQTQGNGWMQSAPMDFWGPLVQSSKCGLAQSLWLKHTEANDPPSPYPMGTPEPCMCYGCELWWLTLWLDCKTRSAMMLNIHIPKKSKLSRKQASLHGPEAWSEESPFNHRSRFRAVARFFKTSSSSCHL